jgi:hypothetical protein
MGGAMLVGGRDFIRTARVWRHRHGGNVFQMLPRQRDRIAREHGVWVAYGFSQTRVPGIVETELQVGEGLASINDADAARAFLRLLEPA